MRININDTVKVRLTDRGRQVYRYNHDTIFSGLQYPFKPVKEDAEGWSSWQLWCLMSEFGPYTSIGAEPCFETEIEIMYAT